ncbi:cobalamin biosynthesis protein [Chloropicon primus]|uniref:Cobalamin biosynthesis protein n=2 Tax=Chloropicon primus TaxID=1764295 RepID=A0A5B8MRT8_9CHLO|nr:cobalamin biosynthesis protein [Chloropicon primus]UPR01857.1 cobalamin biosynthesis protein [Chloropicon primus]|eukprot:QDZ22634.1 cobalamin biosynthesis protein [Chloropicon primus]
MAAYSTTEEAAIRKYKDLPDGKVPVTVLTGFLGSGKTTLLNHLLSENHGLRFAIIENEFGEVGIDEKILGGDDKLKENIDEEVIEVMNGCICCTVRGDLVEALKRLHTKIAKFDGVIIETTGLADPAPVAQTFLIDPEIEKLYELDAIVTVVDAKHLILRLDDEKPEGVENEAQEQLAFADIVLLNKVDLVEEEEELKKVEKRIRDINPNAPIMRTSHSKIDWHQLLGVGAFDISRVLEFEPDFLTNVDAEHEHDNSVTSCSVKFEGELLTQALQEFISELIMTKGADLFRYKGVFACKGMERKFIFQGVGMLFSGGFSPIRWGENETRESRFVFIGRNLDMKELQARVMACKVEEQVLRFKVGDLVEARMGSGWEPGKVIKVWDSGNPYRIQLDEGTCVWGPKDEDVYVRARQ